MQTHEALCTCRTTQLFDFVDITDDIRDAVAASGLVAGRATVFSDSDTCPILVNERESGLLKDIKRALLRVSTDGGIEPPTTIGAKSVVIPIVDGKLRLGTWQRVLLLEMDQPNERSVIVQIVGE